MKAHGEVWKDSFDNRHCGSDKFSVSDRVNQHCLGPADRGLISETTIDNQDLCSMGKGNSRIHSLL